MAWPESGCCYNTGIGDIPEDLWGSASHRIVRQTVRGNAELVWTETPK
jgi:hypothetical protein